ncbi:MAG: ArsR family transcriptional regulator [Candidatus Micrarchaeia archaeon]
MADEPNFIDLFALTKITPQTVVEKFGTSINSSFFDASNILGGLKIKGLIDFTTVFGGQNSVAITDLGHKLLDEATAKVNLPLDHLDIAILVQLSGGKRSLNDLTNTLNIMPKDLSMHLYKMMQQGFLSAEFRNGVLNLMLSEKGFMQAKAGLPTPPPQPVQQSGAPQGLQQMGAQSQPAPPPPPPPAYAAPQQNVQHAAMQQQPQGNVEDIAQQLQQPKKGRKGIAAAVIIIIVVIAVLLLYVLKLI